MGATGAAPAPMTPTSLDCMGKLPGGMGNARWRNAIAPTGCIAQPSAVRQVSVARAGKLPENCDSVPERIKDLQ
ncbi:hypothetical protein GCM10027258_45390 [Amycolatopsis stemonae]